MTASAVSVFNKVGKPPLAARMLLGLLGKLQVGTVVLTGPEGDVHRFAHTPEPYVEFAVHNWDACRQILKSGDIGFAEAYRDGTVSCNCIVSVLLLALANQEIMERTIHGTFWGTWLYRIKHLLNSNSRAGSKKNIHQHYDIGNDFYRLWLDPSMSYSAALFREGCASHEQAQYAKYDRLLDLVEAGPGTRMLEIGCGWGALAEYAATTRGCYVTGVSLSREQLAYANERVKGTPAEDRTYFKYQDYRDIKGHYDVVVSIEMFEAVGEAYWPTYFRKLKALTRPGGKIGLQTITVANERFEDYRSKTDFIQQYIFPGGMLPSPSRFSAEIQRAGLTLNDYFDFGQDYAETLRHWRHAFEGQLDAVRALGLDEAFIKIWRFYLCYCEAGFVAGRTSVCQALLTA